MKLKPNSIRIVTSADDEEKWAPLQTIKWEHAKCWCSFQANGSGNPQKYETSLNLIYSQRQDNLEFFTLNMFQCISVHVRAEHVAAMWRSCAVMSSLVILLPQQLSLFRNLIDGK